MTSHHLICQSNRPTLSPSPHRLTEQNPKKKIIRPNVKQALSKSNKIQNSTELIRKSCLVHPVTKLLIWSKKN